MTKRVDFQSVRLSPEIISLHMAEGNVRCHSTLLLANLRPCLTLENVKIPITVTRSWAELHGERQHWDAQSTNITYASKCQKLQMFVYKRKQKIKKKHLRVLFWIGPQSSQLHVLKLARAETARKLWSQGFSGQKYSYRKNVRWAKSCKQEKAGKPMKRYVGWTREPQIFEIRGNMATEQAVGDFDFP